MEKKELLRLIKQYRAHTISETDLLRLQNYLKDPSSEDDLLEIWDSLAGLSQMPLGKERADKLFGNIISGYRATTAAAANKASRKPARRWLKPAIIGLPAAACLLLFMLFGLNQLLPDTPGTDNKPVAEIVPGGYRARIILDNGQLLDLEQIKTDSVLHFDNFSIKKLANGSLRYLTKDVGGQASRALTGTSRKPTRVSHQPIYNTIITPRGGQYKLTLPDGSQVWVNASSRLRYPVRFNSDKRIISLEGEAYFDVQKQLAGGKKVPFIVKTRGQSVEVLGTEFNISSYGEKIATTLVEGAVEVSFASGNTYRLHPNEQSVFAGDPGKVSITAVDPFYIVAWKNGAFAFDEASIYEVMDNIARWYDVEIDYRGNLSNMRFSGTISRFEQIDKLLNTIAMTGSVKFKTEGRRIIVMK